MIIRHDVNPAHYLAEAKQFAAIVAVDSHLEEVLIGYDNIDQLLKPNLLTSVQTAPEFTLCTDGMGCLIQPDWILTAAHVAEALTEGHKISICNSAYEIQQIFLHPDYTPSNYAYAEDVSQVHHDLALIRLAQPVKAIAPLPLYTQQDELNQIATLVGSGDYGTGLIGPDQADGKLRKATNRIEDVNAEWLVFKFDAPPECTELEGVCGPGDSGGPGLLKVNGKWAIAGVSSGYHSPQSTSFDQGGEGRYGVWEYYTRVSSHLSWIESVLSQ